MPEVVQFFQNGELIARWGDRCGKWNANSLISGFSQPSGSEGNKLMRRKIG